MTTLIPDPPPRPWWRRLTWQIAGVVAVVVAATATYFLVMRDPQCASGIGKVEVRANNGTRHECVGVTDSFAFEPRYRQVMAVVRAENSFATEGGPGTYVTVAFLGPLTSPDERMVHRLEGAVTAQHRANREEVTGDRPRIRLVIGNMDSREGHWRQVVDDLLKRTGKPEHLVAVAGLGLSQNETLWAAERLSRADIPMMGDMLTADEFDKTKVVGLARVNPDVADELGVLARYMRDTRKNYKALLVSYSQEGDFYADAQATDFKREMGAAWTAGGSVDNPFGENPGNEFNIIVSNLCSENSPDVIFYAGRAADLPKFIGYLGNRQCHPGRITVLTGSDVVRVGLDDAENRTAAQALQSQRNPISVAYCPLAEPSVLTKGPEAGPYEAFRRTYQQLGFDPANLGSGWGIMAHDALLAVSKAIRMAAGTHGAVPRAGQVRDMTYLMSTRATSAPGASGLLRLDPRTGNRADVRLPVLQLNPGHDPIVLRPAPAS